MPLTPSSPVASGWSRLTGVILPITIVGAILVLIIPVPPAGPRPAALGQHHAGGDRAADHADDPDAAGVQRLPDDAAGDDAGPAGAQRGDDAADPDARRRRRARRGRRRDPRLRRVRGRRRGRRRRDHLRDHRRDPVRGDHQGGDAHQRSGRAVHAGRHARAADGDRRRPERRHHRRARGAPPPRGRLPPGRLLRGHGRCQQVRPRRRHRRHHHHASSTSAAGCTSAWSSTAWPWPRRSTSSPS